MTDKNSDVIPQNIHVCRERKIMTLTYSDGFKGELSAEFLRISSPSAEVKGHGPGQEIIQAGKRHVLISNIEPVGRYAIRIIFSDGHDTGIFNWSYLHQLIIEKQTRWSTYLQNIHKKGLSRD